MLIIGAIMLSITESIKERTERPKCYNIVPKVYLPKVLYDKRIMLKRKGVSKQQKNLCTDNSQLLQQEKDLVSTRSFNTNSQKMLHLYI